MNKRISSNNLRYLKQEISLLRSAVISIIGEDEEGVYRPELVKQILNAATEIPEYRFRSKDSFLFDLSRI